MKKLTILCVTALFLVQANAQIPNPGFEIRHSDETPANWWPTNFRIFVIDSTCTYLGLDSIRISTHDAHTGDYAYEIRTATACGDTYSGDIGPNQYDSNGFFDQRIQIHNQPQTFTFHYKLYAVQGDLGVAEARMEDQAGRPTGDGVIKLPATAIWTKATLPMSYTMSDTGGFLRLNFRIHNDTLLHYGSRFIIDDIGQSPTGIPGATKIMERLDCFPSPVRNSVSINLSGSFAGSIAVLTITDIAGRMTMHDELLVPHNKTLTVDTRALAPGLYLVKLVAGGKIAAGRFVK